MLLLVLACGGQETYVPEEPAPLGSVNPWADTAEPAGATECTGPEGISDTDWVRHDLVNERGEELSVYELTPDCEEQLYHLVPVDRTLEGYHYLGTMLRVRASASGELLLELVVLEEDTVVVQ